MVSSAIRRYKVVRKWVADNSFVLKVTVIAAVVVSAWCYLLGPENTAELGRWGQQSIPLGTYWVINRSQSALPAEWANRVPYILSGLLWLTTLSIGVALYYFRQRRRLAYGAFETVFGCGSILYFAIELFGAASRDTTSTYIGFIGGVYVVVRGLDNFGKGLDFSPRWDWVWQWWQKHFDDPPKVERKKATNSTQRVT
jgi:hypothetical protein